MTKSGLRERDINVLDPPARHLGDSQSERDRELEAGDRLLCFGKLEQMRDMIPAKARKARRPKIKKLKISEIS